MDTLSDASLEYEISNDSQVSRWPIEMCREMQLNSSTGTSVHLHNGSYVICLEHAPTFTSSTLVRVSILFAMAILSFFGNVATIISIRREKRARSHARPSWTAIYSLIFQLSVADLLVTVFCIAGEAAWSYSVAWNAGNVACKTFKFLQMFALYLSTFILVLIGVDRWLAVRYPMKSIGTATRNGRLVTIAWLLAVVLSVPQAIAFRVAKGPFYEEFHQCVTHGFYTERWQEQMYATLCMVFMFVLPLIILISTYVSTVRTIARSEKVFKIEVQRHEKYLTPDFNRQKLIHRAKMKSLRISVVIVAAFILWWTPYYIMMIIFIFLNPDKNQSEELQSGIFFFGMSNSLVNPIIYGAFHLWPKKKPRRCERDPSTIGPLQASLLRRGDSSIRMTTIRSNRSSLKHSNGQL